VKGTGTRPRMLVRGESLIAWLGPTLAATVLCAVAGTACWNLYVESTEARRARIDQLRGTAELLALGVGSLLAHDDLSGVRRLVSEVARVRGLDVCRVVLPDGFVVADVDSDAITPGRLPEHWGGEPIVGDAKRDEQGAIRVVSGVTVPGRGEAKLELAAPSMVPLWLTWQAQLGIGAISVMGLLGVHLAYRRLRAGVVGLGAIREALLAFSEGTSDTAALRVGERFGPEARAWNALLDERDTLRRQVAENRMVAELHGRSDGRGDLDSACDAMWQGLLLLDASLRVTYANGAAAVFLRAKREEVVGTELPALVSEPRVVEAARGVVGGKVRRRCAVEAAAPGDGAVGVLRFTVRPVRRGDSAEAMIVIEDVTQQKAADEARHSFVAAATHELRTPLTNIRLNIEAALEEGEADPAVRAQALNVINEEARRLERIVGDMLSVAEIEAGHLALKRDDVQVRTLIEQIEHDYLQAAKEKNIGLSFVLPPKVPVIQGDRDKIALALHNLVGNALKYTPSGGKVTVKVDCPGDQVIVDVADTGIGIKPEEHERVFERFYRAKDRRVSQITGTGLGLTLAREVARLHGGDVTLQSELDKGSTFRLSIPTAAAA